MLLMKRASDNTKEIILTTIGQCIWTCIASIIELIVALGAILDTLQPNNELQESKSTRERRRLLPLTLLLRFTFSRLMSCTCI